MKKIALLFIMSFSFVFGNEYFFHYKIQKYLNSNHEFSLNCSKSIDRYKEINHNICNLKKTYADIEDLEDTANILNKDLEDISIKFISTVNTDYYDVSKYSKVLINPIAQLLIKGVFTGITLDFTYDNGYYFKNSIVTDKALHPFQGTDFVNSWKFSRSDNSNLSVEFYINKSDFDKSNLKEPYIIEN